ncbi:MAG: fatty acyl-AMP ligase [Deltaproteobacteria bacterium]|nr:fatty acyl-AMP ligase [Deltaproteobacteria bacterium]
MDTATSHDTLIDVLEHRVAAQPDLSVYRFLTDRGNQETSLTTTELQARARGIAARLQALGMEGERALLIYPPGLDYIEAFLGCLHAGAVAVPAYPPDPMRLERTVPRLLAIARDCRARVALTIAPVMSIVESLALKYPELAQLTWIATDEVPASEADSWTRPDVSAGTLAFLQYTSGSTATPRGVMLTHGNLLHNSAMITEGFGVTPGMCGVSWLPPYHDMGLIGGILQPLYAGVSTFLMSPMDFLQRPLTWLQAISRHRAAASGGPNFAYDLCVRRTTPEQRAELDLGCWKVAYSGAEPVRAATLEKFADAFAVSGFRAEAFLPCYGLAEATLFVTGGSASPKPRVETFDAAELAHHRAVPAGGSDRPLVSCGRVAGSQRLIVVDPDTLEELPPDRVGEVWLHGPSVASGYFGRPEETAATFAGHLAGTGEGPFLRTGDLGFLRDGELFITGRIKDVIIVDGRNHYPQDIELTVERSHPVVRPGCCAAFSVDGRGVDRLVVTLELNPSRVQGGPPSSGEVIAAVRAAVAREHDLRVDDMVLLQPGTIPKTTSGKIQRHACRNGYLGAALQAWTPEALAA